MSPPALLRPRLLSFALGVHLSLVQTGFYMMLETFVSSQAFSYFLVLFAWLIGLLVGLRVARPRAFCPLLLLGLVAYEGSLWTAHAFPFSRGLVVVATVSTFLAGLLPGHFFASVAPRVSPVRSALAAENDGFVVGLGVALVLASRAGPLLLVLGPAVSLVAVVLVRVSLKASRSTSRC